MPEPVSPRLTPDTLLDTALELPDCCAALAGALREHAQAAEALAAARSALARREAQLTAQGLEGKNSEQRAAALRLALDAEHTALEQAERQQARASLELELAREAWRCLRYRARLLEAAAHLSE